MEKTLLSATNIGYIVTSSNSISFLLKVSKVLFGKFCQYALLYLRCKCMKFLTFLLYPNLIEIIILFYYENINFISFYP